MEELRNIRKEGKKTYIAGKRCFIGFLLRGVSRIKNGFGI